MSSPAIIVVAFNRPASLTRLLKSILRADYRGINNIPLIISIDGGGGKENHKIASAVEWPYGAKQIILHEKNIGLRRHILSCGDLSEKYGSVIILEDDSYVSKNFYSFSKEALEFYEDDYKIAGIGLHSYRYNENAFLPFAPIIDGREVYFMQVPCSWGQAWTTKQWKDFRDYYRTNNTISDSDKIPDSVKKWPESSWKKYFSKYMVETNRYFVYPVVSYATNFADPGENWNNGLTFFQVPLEHQIEPEHRLISFDQSDNKYDAYFEILSDSLMQFGANIDPDTCIDIYGTKQTRFIENEYMLSIKQCTNPIFSYGVELRPPAQNIFLEFEGNVYRYSQTKNFKDKISNAAINYIWDKQQPQGYYFASRTLYFKLGYYLLHPLKYFRKRLKYYKSNLLR